MYKKAYKKNIKTINETMTYVEALEKGLVDYEDIDDFIDIWHEGGTNKELHQYLGMTLKQYKEYFKDDEKALKRMFKKGSKK